MKELIITCITLAGLFIGINYYDSIIGQVPAEPQKTEVAPAAH